MYDLYKFMKAFPGITPDQYWDMPDGVTRWLTRIDDLHVERENAERKKANG